MVIHNIHVIIAILTNILLDLDKLMINIIQITDLHLYADRNKTANNINTFESAQLVFEAIDANEVGFDMLILSVDLSDDESDESYENLKYLLRNFECPIYLMSGNHDSPQKIKSICNTSNLKSQNYKSIGEWGVFMFNTKKDNSPNGILHQNELDYFDKVISGNKNSYLLVMLHHHPILIGSDSMDKMIIENSTELLDRINNNKINTIFIKRESPLNKIIKLPELIFKIFQFLKKSKNNLIIIEGASWIFYSFIVLFSFKILLPNSKIIYISHSIESEIRKKYSNKLIYYLTKFLERFVFKYSYLSTSVSKLEQNKIKKL